VLNEDDPVTVAAAGVISTDFDSVIKLTLAIYAVTY